MAAVFRKTVVATSGSVRNNLQYEQDSWDNSKHGCWAPGPAAENRYNEVDCIADAYRTRIHQLTVLLSGRKVAIAPSDSPNVSVQKNENSRGKEALDESSVATAAESNARLAQQVELESDELEGAIQFLGEDVTVSGQQKEQPDQQSQAEDSILAPIEFSELADSIESNQVSDEPTAIPSVAALPEQSASTAIAGDEESQSLGPLGYIFVIVAYAFIGLIPAFIALLKGHGFLKWWIYGAILFPVALLHSLFIKHPSVQGTPPTPTPNITVAQPAQGHVLRPAAPRHMQPVAEGGIQQRLMQFSHHVQCACVGCGYAGYMGLVKRTKPLHENGMFKLAAFMSRGPVRNWYAASAFMGGVAKNVLECPSCGNRLEQEAGSRPTLMLFGG